METHVRRVALSNLAHFRVKGRRSTAKPRLSNYQLKRDEVSGGTWAAGATQDSSLPLPELKDRLELAVRAEDYKAAAEIRDELQRRETDARSAVEEVNRLFYLAFERCDLKAMERIWGKGNHVQCMHPITACISGHENVLESWRLILRGAKGLNIALEDVRIYAGDNDAFVTCVEVIQGTNERGRTAATNVFEKQNGKWVLIHHHGGPLPPSDARAQGPTEV